jgi:hypothetical protein
MNAPQMFRSVAAMALAIGLFITLGGCGNKPPSEKKDEKKTDPPLNINTSTPGANTSTPVETTATIPPTPKRIDPEIEKLADNFLKATVQGSAQADQLSTEFVKAIGLPAALPADKARGYSPDVAESWLRRIGPRLSVGPARTSKLVGNVALFRGTVYGEVQGDYWLRMVQEGGAWKVDWLSMTTTKIVELEGQALSNPNGDSLCQEFAATAVMGLLVDKDALSKEYRTLILAAGLTPALKKKWAEPLDSDKQDGFDYNRGLLAQKTAEFNGDVLFFSVNSQTNSPDFQVVITRGGGVKTTYLMKLAKGSGPCQWLVDDLIKQ